MCFGLTNFGKTFVSPRTYAVKLNLKKRRKMEKTSIYFQREIRQQYRRQKQKICRFNRKFFRF
ncbi:hypothetical protein EGI11_04200 [Chryseobacterium sp. H3056]|uniref:Uncharacterized protein n=1 Tax=Kaistella daneshvariae TaxID=2487074 RepID=A0A3N0WXX7_9FLAO|nr:hypothetical protein EGI11_04200 [Kaistella daneshvariae]